jgi:hypothetical protein
VTCWTDSRAGQNAGILGPVWLEQSGIDKLLPDSDCRVTHLLNSGDEIFLGDAKRFEPTFELDRIFYVDFATNRARAFL